nr:hypothetical protein BaRGS_022970 [Batillaria attramentaria]
MDGTYLGTFPTHEHSDWGHMWNVFFATRPFPRALDLPAGWHGLRLGVLLPSDGVEIDSVRVWFSDSRLTRPMVECQLFCRTSLPVVPTNNAVLPQLAEVRQASYPTKCAEEDNVKVPLYLPDISEYTITATMPTYTSFANRRDANTTGCPYLSPLHWAFKGVAIPSPGPVSRVSGSANLLLLRGGGGGGGGQTKGHVTFPDFTWRERATNVVLLEVRSRDPVLVEEAKLERRPMKGETVHTVYRSGRVVVEAVEVDFWWRRPETMQLINGETGQKWVKVDFFRIYLTVPWNGGYSQLLCCENMR